MELALDGCTRNTLERILHRHCDVQTNRVADYFRTFDLSLFCSNVTEVFQYEIESILLLLPWRYYYGINIRNFDSVCVCVYECEN